ncbi:hypothetical protein F5884DRAFT_330085 [Xylogone sp. PMI_703]|nr:hypothetical protein F5884DRAFT_330085 [Xylogone sp. PMI_703]
MALLFTRFTTVLLPTYLPVSLHIPCIFAAAHYWWSLSRACMSPNRENIKAPMTLSIHVSFINTAFNLAPKLTKSFLSKYRRGVAA